MSIFKILGGIGAGVLAAAGLVVAGRTGLGKSDEPADTAAEPAGGGDAPATETAEEESSESDPESDDSANA